MDGMMDDHGQEEGKSGTSKGRNHLGTSLSPPASLALMRRGGLSNSLARDYLHKCETGAFVETRLDKLKLVQHPGAGLSS